MRLWVLISILKIGMLSDSLFKECGNLSLKIRLTAQSNKLSCVLEDVKRCLTLFIPS